MSKKSTTTCEIDWSEIIFKNGESEYKIRREK